MEDRRVQHMNSICLVSARRNKNSDFLLSLSKQRRRDFCFWVSLVYWVYIEIFISSAAEWQKSTFSVVCSRRLQRYFHKNNFAFAKNCNNPDWQGLWQSSGASKNLSRLFVCGLRAKEKKGDGKLNFLACLSFFDSQQTFSKAAVGRHLLAKPSDNWRRNVYSVVRKTWLLKTCLS